MKHTNAWSGIARAMHEAQGSGDNDRCTCAIEIHILQQILQSDW